MILYFQLLGIVGAAAFAGVMLAIALILGPLWRSLPPADFMVWFAVNSGFIARTIPIVVIPTLIGLVGAIALSWGDAATRNLWIASLGCIVALLVLTVVYFFPMNASFNAGSIPLTDVSNRIDAWLSIHWIRIPLALLASTLGFLAIQR